MLCVLGHGARKSYYNGCDLMLIKEEREKKDKEWWGEFTVEEQVFLSSACKFVYM